MPSFSGRHVDLAALKRLLQTRGVMLQFGFLKPQADQTLLQRWIAGIHRAGFNQGK